jgi:hypothetical protein
MSTRISSKAFRPCVWIEDCRGLLPFHHFTKWSHLVHLFFLCGVIVTTLLTLCPYFYGQGTTTRSCLCWRRWAGSTTTPSRHSASRPSSSSRCVRGDLVLG